MVESRTGAGVSPSALTKRLGVAALGTAPDVRAVADLIAGEALVAVVVAMWRRQGWAVAATDEELRLARRPRLFGRARDVRFEWKDLTSVTAGPLRVTMAFGESEVDLLGAAPHEEVVRLLDAARGHLGDGPRPSVGHLRELAQRKLGRLLASAFEATIEGLPDRLQPGEQVERLAGATLDFAGMLTLTDRRLLLVDITLRRVNERLWEVDRDAIHTVEVVDDGLRLALPSGQVTLTEFLPPERRDEFAAVLRAR